MRKCEDIPALIPLMESVKDASGDYAELGVFIGETFVTISEFAHAQRRHCHAIDSFAGVSEPTAEDGGVYQKGKWNAKGTGPLIERLTDRWGKDWDNFIHIYEGWIPEILEKLDQKTFAFVHLDIDLYAPTVAALKWIWPRITDGGVLACHDYVPGSKILVTRAIDEFFAEQGVKAQGQEDRTIWFGKEKA